MAITNSASAGHRRSPTGKLQLALRVSSASILLIAISSTVDGDSKASSTPAFVPSGRIHRSTTAICSPTNTVLASSISDDTSAEIVANNNNKVSKIKSKWINSIKNNNNNNPSTFSQPYVRIQKRGRHYDVQTAITTFQKHGENNTPNNDYAKKPLSVDLHAQIHFGDESYFEYFNNHQTFGSFYDKILYELIVEEKLLSSDPGMLKTLTPVPGYLNPIAPTSSDRNTASQYGLRCQVDAINYCQGNWIHADLTREEFFAKMEENEQSSEIQQTPHELQKQQQQKQQLLPLLLPKNSPKQPLWALASTSATYPGSEIFTALLRPLAGNTDLSNSAALTRRLFTHLFLPGDALSGWIRAVLWCGVPSPELSIMLVDWSSLSYTVGRRRRRRRSDNNNGASRGNNNNNNNIAPISPIAAPVLLSLLTGNWGTARRLVFGQVLVGGQSNSDTSKNGVLIQARNERAMEVLRKTVEVTETLEDVIGDDVDVGQQKRIALLYGAAHCRDLHRRLVEEEGMVPVRTEWRTAFRATAPRWGDYFEMEDWAARSSKDVTSGLGSTSSELAQLGEDVLKSMSVSTLESVAVGLVVLPLYLLVGGLDWVSTMGDLGNALDAGMYADGVAAVILYLLRHVALYVAISKFVVDWGGSDGVFEDVDTL